MKKQVIKSIHFAPIAGKEDQAPSMATHVVVGGGTDVVTFTFFHVGSATLRKVFQEGGPQVGSTIEFRNGAVTVKSDPVATVAVPLSVVLEMITDVVETIVTGVPGLQDSMNSFGTRMADILSNAGAHASVLTSLKSDEGNTNKSGEDESE